MRIGVKVQPRLITFACLLVLVGVGNAFAQERRSVPDGEQVKKMKGVVAKREPDSFLMADPNGGPQVLVVLTDQTEVKSHKKGVFRGSKEYGASYILRGLRLEVDGVGNADGAIVADKIRF